jgi:hypothetical protein
VDTVSSKNERVIVRDLKYDVKASKLDPPANGGTVIDYSYVGPKTVYEFIWLHPRKIGHIAATLKNQLTTRLVVLK